MAYRLEADETPAQGIKRIALEQIDKALGVLADPSDRDEAVHDARKRFKQVRALVRLVRDEVGQDVYRTENVCFRDAGRLLSEVRASQVLVGTLDALTERYAAYLSDPAIASIREKLADRHEEIAYRVLEEEEAIAAVVDMVQGARKRVETWPIRSTDFDAFHGGLKRVYQRGRKGMAGAYADPSIETFHEWRKRVKYLWYHVRILHPIWPDLLSPLANALDDLSDLLGQEHDLAELKLAIQVLPDVDYSTERVQFLFSIIWQQRNELQARAQPLGERIYQEKPSAFVARIGDYWRIHAKERALDEVEAVLL